MTAILSFFNTYRDRDCLTPGSCILMLIGAHEQITPTLSDIKTRPRYPKNASGYHELPDFRKWSLAETVLQARRQWYCGVP